MEDKKAPRSEVLLLKNISICASRGNLWPRTFVGPVLETNLEKIIPEFKITQNFKQSLQRFAKESNFCAERYVKTVESVGNKAELELNDILFFFNQKNKEHLIKFIQAEELSSAEIESMINTIEYKIDSFNEQEHLDTFDLCIPLIQYFIQNYCLKLKYSLLFPSISFTFQPIAPLKLVSTPLSLSLIKKETFSCKFQTGYLTMDQKMRVLPLKSSDKQLLRFPIIGIWATGLKTDINNDSKIWAACIRFLENRHIHERISPSPEKNLFLFVFFSPKPIFYEASSSNASWKIVSKQKFSNNGIKFWKKKEKKPLNPRIREKKSLTASTSSSESRFSRIPSSFEVENTEKMIWKQNLMLKSLEKQINELQHALSEPKLVNAETNTTNYFASNKPGRLNTRRQSDIARESSDSALNNNILRSSCKIDRIGLFNDATIHVPKIIYNPDSDDEESLFEMKFIPWLMSNN